MRSDSGLATALLVAIALLLRIALVSSPYYVDGPNHVKAISDGSLFIQPPGYFLFALAARGLMLLAHVPAAQAISAINIAFSIGGLLIFRQICSKLFPGVLGLALSVCYAVSNVVWFAAEIHSTYASMTFFGPLLLYFLLVQERIRWAWIVWAVLTGFRPSDGIFLLPLMIYASAKRPWRESVAGMLFAFPICAAWYVPTVIRFGGGPLAPFSAAGHQLGQLPSGFLVQGFHAKGWNNLLHFITGTLNSWNVLLPFVAWGVLTAARWRSLALVWMVPASVFFAFYFVSDSLYLAFLVAPGLLLAGTALSSLRDRRIAVAVTAASVVVASVHMLLLRPIAVRNVPEAVANSYILDYSGWALKHRYAKRLATAIAELQQTQPSRGGKP